MLRSSPSINILATHLPGRHIRDNRHEVGGLHPLGWVDIKVVQGRPICPLHLLFALGAILGHQGECPAKSDFIAFLVH